jgi:hypothetical protein
MFTIRREQHYPIITVIRSGGKMGMRLLIFASIFAFMAVVIPASCSPQVIPLGSHNISLDFGGQNITVMLMTTAYECCLGVDTNYAKMVDNNTNSSSFAYLFSYDSPRPISDSEKELNCIMNAMCDKMSIQPYENGYISTGSDRIGGQALWGIIEPLNVRDNNYTTCVEIVASFMNGTLNEHIVKTAQL